MYVIIERGGDVLSTVKGVKTNYPHPSLDDNVITLFSYITTKRNFLPTWSTFSNLNLGAKKSEQPKLTFPEIVHGSYAQPSLPGEIAF